MSMIINYMFVMQILVYVLYGLRQMNEQVMIGWEQLLEFEVVFESFIVDWFGKFIN